MPRSRDPSHPQKAQVRGFPPPVVGPPLEALDDDVVLDLHAVCGYLGLSLSAVLQRRKRAEKAKRDGKSWPSLPWVRRKHPLSSTVTAKQLKDYIETYRTDPAVRRWRGIRGPVPKLLS